METKNRAKTVDYPALRQSDLEGWGADNEKGTFHYEGVFVELPEYYHDISQLMKVEFIGGTDRGAIIIIWEKMNIARYKPTKNADMYSDGEWAEWKLFDQVSFMHYVNAVEEFSVIKDFGDILDLCRRNS